MSSDSQQRDLVIYGGTSGGVAGGLQAARMKRSVTIIEPGRRIGGLTTGGLGSTDIGNKAAIGGIAREFYRRIKRHYDATSSWRWQSREQYEASHNARAEDAMWKFEPSAAWTALSDMLGEFPVEIIYGERLQRDGGVEMDGPRIRSLRMESGRIFHAKMFIDATYEGDLMAAAGLGFHVGREAASLYGEDLNGVRTREGKYHQFQNGVDPYVIKGNPSSGLLPGIDSSGPGPEGGGDGRLQAYCFRMCLTDHPENRIPFLQPEGFQERDYELLLRNFEAGESHVPWINSAMPNRKTDTNNRLGFSTDFIGQNYTYPNAGYAEREEIIRRHLRYQQGLMWTLANHPRVPEPVRREVGRWGLCRDEFPEGRGWQSQLYIREARRMVGALVMTQRHCQGKAVVDDPVGLAAYTMDSHHVQRYVDSDGGVRNEGDVEVGGFPPYPVSFRAIVPKPTECVNLSVPVCLSASHIAYGSIRMEPVFMVLGQSAATAAVHAIEERAALQEISYERLRERLLADEQRLA